MAWAWVFIAIALIGTLTLVVLRSTLKNRSDEASMEAGTRAAWIEVDQYGYRLHQPPTPTPTTLASSWDSLTPAQRAASQHYAWKQQEARYRQAQQRQAKRK